MPKDLHPYAVIRRPIITEKSTELAEISQYVFEVDPRANKLQVKEAVEIGFNVVVRRVNTMTVRGKKRRFGRHQGVQRDWKKAVVTLAAGYQIKLFEGV
jgi:large subunit ribosomal protein L23